jgi:hypothetical protein
MPPMSAAVTVINDASAVKANDAANLGVTHMPPAKVVIVTRGRGRPRLNTPNVRVECMIPRTVYDRLIAAEQAGHGYRTRIAAKILCGVTQNPMLCDELVGGVTHPGTAPRLSV